MFKLIQAISQVFGLQEKEYLKFLDIVCVGTISDIVPLKDENRVITNDTKADNTTKNVTTPTNNNTNTSNTSVNGKYQFKSQTDNYYHEATIEISNQNETSIIFSINAAHGMNVDNVNIGEVKGKATKIEVPNATQYAYQFEETQDGNTAKIILVYTAHKMFEYVTVKEEYSNGINPYAGHNVWFSGDYEKVN